jgi:hypothetical protein
VAPQLGAMGFKNIMTKSAKLEASFPAPIDVSERTGEQSGLTLNPGNCNSFLVRHPLYGHSGSDNEKNGGISDEQP